MEGDSKKVETVASCLAESHKLLLQYEATMKACGYNNQKFLLYFQLAFMNACNDRVIPSDALQGLKNFVNVCEYHRDSTLKHLQ